MNKNKSLNHEEYDELQIVLNNYYPKAPFTIDCVKTIAELHEPFSYREYVIICDIRGLHRQNLWQLMTETQQEKHKHYLVIQCLNNKPITLHRVINELIANKHYRSKQHVKDDNKYLEGFITDDKVMYTINWGS